MTKTCPTVNRSRSQSVSLTGFIVICLLGSVLTAEAATYYVATTGDDDRSCAQAQTIGTPRRMLNAGIGCLSPGDTLYLRGGTYAETLYGRFPGGTSWTNAKTVAGYPGETVTVPGGWDLWGPETQYWIFDNLHFDGRGVQDGFATDCEYDRSINQWVPNSCAHHIRIQNSEFANIIENVGGSGRVGPDPMDGCCNEYINLDVHHSYPAVRPEDQPEAFYMNSGYHLFENNRFYVNGGTVINLRTGSLHSGIDYNVIRNNRFYYNGLVSTNNGAIFVTHGVGNKVYNNFIYGDGGPAIVVWANARDTEIDHNTMYRNGYQTVGARPCIEVRAGSTNTLIRNNICYQNAAPGISVDSSVTATLQNNLLDVDPQFVDAANGNLHLKAGSSAIDAGVDLSAAGVTTDFDGTPRPQGNGYDIGAYEFKVGGMLRGDLDGNGKLDLTDVRWCIEMLVGTRPKDLATADLDGNGTLALADVQALIRLLVGLP